MILDINIICVKQQIIDHPSIQCVESTTEPVPKNSLIHFGWILFYLEQWQATYSQIIDMLAMQHTLKTLPIACCYV